jgi:apolipoprotein N-acyltransferase
MTQRQFFFLIIFLGFITGLSSAPIKGFQLFAVSGFSSLFYLFDHTLFSKRKALWIGSFAFGYFLMALHWIVFSLHVNWGLYFYLVPFALLGLPLFFGLYHALIFWVVPWPKEGLKNPFFFASLWTILEIIRAEFLTGFPWASLGYMWTTVLPLAQLASFIGPYGLSFLTVLWALSPYVFLSKKYTSFSKKLYGAFVLITIGSAWIYGILRLEHPAQLSDVTLRLVQPNSPQEFHWTPEKMEAQLEEFVSLSKSPKNQTIKAVIWPEFSLPFAPQVYPWMSDIIKKAVPDGGLLITNGFFYEKLGDGYKVYNATLVLDEGPHLVDFYGKHRLLPFGEYIPLRSWIDAIFPGQIHKMSGGMGDFAPGAGPKVLEAEGLPPFVSMVCHESIFSSAFHGEGLDRAAWILALTNDGWFLNSLGPYQHLEIMRMRAIEMGLPLVRVANTGITAVIDPLGRSLVEIPYGQKKGIDVFLPQAMDARPFYAKYVGRSFYPGLALFFEFMILLALLFKLYRRRK